MRWLFAALLALNLLVSGASLYTSYYTAQGIGLVGSLLWELISSASSSEGQEG